MSQSVCWDTASGRFWGQGQASGTQATVLLHSSAVFLRGTEGLCHLPSRWGHQKPLSHQVAGLLLGTGPGHSVWSEPALSAAWAMPGLSTQGPATPPPQGPGRTLHKLLLTLTAARGAPIPGQVVRHRPGPAHLSLPLPQDHLTLSAGSVGGSGQSCGCSGPLKFLWALLGPGAPERLSCRAGPPWTGFCSGKAASPSCRQLFQGRSLHELYGVVHYC